LLPLTLMTVSTVACCRKGKPRCSASVNRMVGFDYVTEI
jgi:hypothetical protein